MEKILRTTKLRARQRRAPDFCTVGKFIVGDFVRADSLPHDEPRRVNALKPCEVADSFGRDQQQIFLDEQPHRRILNARRASFNRVVKQSRNPRVQIQIRRHELKSPGRSLHVGNVAFIIGKALQERVGNFLGSATEFVEPLNFFVEIRQPDFKRGKFGGRQKFYRVGKRALIVTPRREDFIREDFFVIRRASHECCRRSQRERQAVERDDVNVGEPRGFIARE